MASSPTRRGRRPGPSTTRQEILDAARTQFSERGYNRTTLRSIADGAGVQPALLHHYFGTKQRLYRAALDLPVNPTEVLSRLLEETPREDFAGAFARHAISAWRDPDTGAWLRAMTRQILADPDAAALMRAHWETMLVPRIATALGVPEANVAAAGASLLGITLVDSLVGVSQLSQISEDEFVALIAPAIDQLLPSST